MTMMGGKRSISVCDTITYGKYSSKKVERKELDSA